MNQIHSIAFALMASAAIPAAIAAESYPSKPIRMIVPFTRWHFRNAGAHPRTEVAQSVSPGLLHGHTRKARRH